MKSRVSPEIVFGDYDCCYLFYARNPAEFHSRWRFIQSKGCGIIDSVKKLGSLLAIALPFASAVSVGKARAQTFPGVSTTNVARLGFVSQASTATDPSLVAKGKTRYADYKCDECHGANGEGGEEGPDLISTRLNADEISKFLEKPSPDAYMKGMPNIPSNHPDNQVLVAYVMSLKRPPTSEVRPAQPTAAPSEGLQKKDSTAAHKLSAAEKAHILDGDFTIEYKVDRLPDSLKSAFARLAKQPEFKMANPDEKFEATDYISDPELPTRRLIFAGVSKNRYFIHYEHGGRGYHHDVVVFDVNPDGKVSFLGSGSGRAKDLAQLRALVSSKSFGDGSNHF